MIRIICGTCETVLGYKTRADGELTLPAAQEKRLVERGVAEYVTRPVINDTDNTFGEIAGDALRRIYGTFSEDTASGADSPVDGGDGGGAGIDPASDTPPVEGMENGGGGTFSVTLPVSADTLDVVDGHFTRESLLLMRRPDMEKLAGDLGVDVSRCKNKSDIADLLVEVEVEIDAPMKTDGEAPPELGAEAPVV